jgi:hypothetical protein
MSTTMITTMTTTMTTTTTTTSSSSSSTDVVSTTSAAAAIVAQCGVVELLNEGLDLLPNNLIILKIIGKLMIVIEQTMVNSQGTTKKQILLDCVGLILQETHMSNEKRLALMKIFESQQDAMIEIVIETSKVLNVAVTKIFKSSWCCGKDTVVLPSPKTSMTSTMTSTVTATVTATSPSPSPSPSSSSSSSSSSAGVVVVDNSKSAIKEITKESSSCYRCCCL